MNSVQRFRAVVLIAAAGLCLAAPALGDGSSRAAVNASPAQLAGLGLPIVPDGSNVRIAIIEAVGVAQLNPPNLFMPPAGNDVNARVQNLRVGADSHSTMVTGVIMDTFDGVAQNSRVQVDIGNTTNNFIQRSQFMLYTNPNRGAPLNQTNGDATILNMSLAGNGVNSALLAGNSIDTRWIDWAARTQAGHPLQDKLMVAAGNEPAGTVAVPERSVDTLDNFNGITVGATAGNNYRTLATYNGRYNAAFTLSTQNRTFDASPYNGILNNNRVGRFKTDIVAPGGGDGVTMISPVVVGSAEDNHNNIAPNNGLNSDPAFAGTSFAAPHVSGGAALVTHLGVNRGFSTDHKVLKAVLLNGASKDVAHWDRTLAGPGIPAGNAWRPRGFLSGNDAFNLQKRNAANETQSVRIGWDEDLGTGLLDVGASLKNYLPGEMNPGPVGPVGWDLHSITPATNNQYVLPGFPGGTTEITATLAWDRFLQLRTSTTDQTPLPNQLWAPGNNIVASTLNDLDLEIWNLSAPGGAARVFFSNSDTDSIEHVFWSVPLALQGSQFAIRVNFFNDFATIGAESYGLAWRAIPTPGVAALLAFGGIAALARRRRA